MINRQSIIFNCIKNLNKQHILYLQDCELSYRKFNSGSSLQRLYVNIFSRNKSYHKIILANIYKNKM